MTRRRAIEMLQEYQRWRRGEPLLHWFQFTPVAGRHDTEGTLDDQVVSIHARLATGDFIASAGARIGNSFNSRPLLGDKGKYTKKGASFAPALKML